MLLIREQYAELKKIIDKVVSARKELLDRLVGVDARAD